MNELDEFLNQLRGAEPKPKSANEIVKQAEIVSKAYVKAADVLIRLSEINHISMRDQTTMRATLCAGIVSDFPLSLKDKSDENIEKSVRAMVEGIYKEAVEMAKTFRDREERTNIKS